ncbi:MAG TPA: GrpB family protein [Candidatus Dormibacteraeota bacterium]|nr:GrpB family protein [Candidatus Dormibacteraeota bacterium]
MEPAARPIVVVDADPGWPERFSRLGARLRSSLGSRAVRIDHIGSTAVPDLDAKPVIDVQVSVVALEPVDLYRGRLEACGFVWREHNPELTKRYFRERPGDRETHIHVRRAGSLDEQLALLLRDYLRTHPDTSREYAALKRRLARTTTTRLAYTEGKAPFTWATLRAADAWAQDIGWEPDGSDA